MNFGINGIEVFGAGTLVSILRTYFNGLSFFMFAKSYIKHYMD